MRERVRCFLLATFVAGIRTYFIEYTELWINFYVRVPYH